ncbi:AAA family ATPase [Rhodoferax antarcticus]|uniref:AAA family ATPase n=1 Tax=Rhodoferax antarcticus TaxID=81479 RepID=UPI00095835A4|nr:AAA family ATPase [Rhodoferax antarcticus]APW46918.1 AAA family ATPase [Rhodoferax antarcticus]
MTWVWENWLAQGKLHVLAGAPGQGKTTLALAMAATITAGGLWPDGSRSSLGNVLVWSGEDHYADTLLPRLIAMGADRSRVFFVTGARISGELLTFDPARDLNQLLRAIEKIGGINLLVVDPIVSAVAGDSHKNTEVRRALQPLVDLAAHCNCAALGISHFSKGGQGQDPTQRVVGSVAFSAVARVVMVAAKMRSEDGKDRRILARSKSNIGPDDGGFEYHIEQTEALPGIQASYIAWGDAVAGTARELLTEPDDGASGPSESADKSAQDEAEEFLIELLKDGPSPTKHVETEAKAAGLAWRTVRRASDTLGVKKRKTEGAWYWSKSNLSNEVVQLVQHSNVGQVGQVDGQHEIKPEDSNILNGESSESSDEMESSDVEFL